MNNKLVKFILCFIGVMILIGLFVNSPIFAVILMCIAAVVAANWAGKNF